MQSPQSVFASPWSAISKMIMMISAINVGSTCPTGYAQDDLASAPYVVFVAHDEAYTRCGPSGEYYRTDPLRHGQELEVYVETEDGWLGIRPPENSFCWVPATAVQLNKSGDGGVVIEDRTVAWIGTNLGRAREYRWQVQLAEGEEVTIIGRSERDGPDGPQLWFRIVPPSGEFRWIHRDQTVASTEALVAAVRQQTQNNDIESLPEDGETVQPAQHLADSADVRNPATASQDVVAEDDSRLQLDPLSRSRESSSRRTIRSPGERSTAIQPFKAQLATSGGSTPQPVASNETPSFQEAPIPRRNDVPGARSNSVGDAVSTAYEPTYESDAAIGSGLQQDWRSNQTRGSVDHQTAAAEQQSHSRAMHSDAQSASATMASASFVGPPRLIEIGSNLDQSAPQSNETAGDGNWVSGMTRQSNVAQVAGIGPMPAQTLVPNISHPSTQQRSRVISRDSITRVENEVRGADVEKLQLVLSRLMGQRASSEETAPLVNEAYRIAETVTDEVTAGRARLVAERAEQYQRIAERRDGIGAAIQSESMVIPAGGQATSNTLPSQNSGSTMDAQMSGDSGAFAETGFLVQVYSARTNSPPFALTDHSGNTVAYVTPSPGINLRTHLNSRISVVGNVGYLQGLNTPHILVTRAVRTRE